MCGLGSNICILILVILNIFNNNIFNINIIARWMMMTSLRWRANVWSWLGQLALGKRLVSIFTLDRWLAWWQWWFNM